MRRPGIMWSVVLLIFTCIMGVLLIGGNVLLYLSPRMVPMVWFGFAVFAVLFVHQLFRRYSVEVRNDNRMRLKNLVFLIPVILVLTVPPNATTSGTLPNKNVQMLSMAGADTPDTEDISEPVPSAAVQTAPPGTTQRPRPSEAMPTDTPTEDIPEEETETSAAAVEPADALPCRLVDDTVPFDVSADMFDACIYSSATELAGQTMTLYGFVYTDDSFPEDTVMVSRLYIYCCAADATIVGFHVKVEDMSAFEDNEWICVTGTVQAISLAYRGDYYDFPILTDGTVSRCTAPDAEDAYIYP